MKNLILPIILLAIAFACVIPQTASAQMTGQQIERLVALQQQLEKEYLQQRQLVEAYARQHNIQVRQQVGDDIIVLHRIENGEPVFIKDDNSISQQTSAADQVKTGGTLNLTLTGAGQTLGIWEAGGAVRATHQEFGGRVTQVDAVATTNHATHVAGTMIAGGTDANALGFSSAANLQAYDSAGDDPEMAAAAIAATPIRVSNHSYGTIAGWDLPAGTATWVWNNNQWRFGAYDVQAQNWDNIANAAPFYLIVKSAGNDRNDAGASGVNHLHAGDPVTLFNDNHPADCVGGFDCISDRGTSKNILTVGAVNPIPGGYVNAAGVAMSNFSGWGPTDDGRIKPDLVADGVNLYSSGNAADNAYSTLSGTSMAAPSTSGSIGLLLEHWADLNGGVPRATVVKSLLIQTADESGPSAGPDYMFGWGLLNVSDAAQVITTNAYDGCEQIFTGTVNGGGGTWTYTFESSGLVPVKATLAWSDPAPAAVNAGVTNPPGAAYLVNNLDLQITEGANTFRPWVLDPANPGNAATTGVNNRDNVEQVLINSPAAGTYTITVTFANGVAADAQVFALILTGNDAALENNTVSAITITDTRTYTVRNTLTFGPDVTINSPGDVRGIAGKHVHLVPGFEVNAGGKFLGRIQTGGICAGETGTLKPSALAVDKPIAAAAPSESLKQSQVKASAEASGLRIFPNPASRQVQFRVEIPAQGKISLTAFDQLGQMVFQPISDDSYGAGEHSFEWDVAHLPPGLYYVMLETAEGRSVQKLVVQR
jgi:subtilisin family serine protease